MIYHNCELFRIHHGEKLSVVDESIVVNVCLVDDHWDLFLLKTRP